MNDWIHGTSYTRGRGCMKSPNLLKMNRALWDQYYEDKKKLDKLRDERNKWKRMYMKELTPCETCADYQTCLKEGFAQEAPYCWRGVK